MSRTRNVVVRLRAEVADFKRQMQEATKATEAIGAKAKGAGKEIGSAFRDNRQAMDQVANQALIVGGAMTALTGLVAKTGIEYNTLQQTSRAALTTLLGGAEAANAQMDKLDEFARNSPFAKQVFLNAQRQLIGFGYEAEQVLPILDAIQNAVAATGGSNQDIAELVRIFAQVRAAGKITAVDLMQFGQRGVDAAALIGSAMGKTGAQIRDEITNGTLDADVAVQALTDGMQERFGGAAENVKNTFAGATDRVRAAIRDISADFMNAFVDPSGGGLLVDWTNGLADLLRGFQALPDPVKNTTGAVFAFSGVGLVAMGSAIKLGGALMDAHDSLGRIAESAPRAAGAIRGLGTVTAAAAAAVAIMEAYNQAGIKIDEWRNGAIAAHEDVVAQIISGSDELARYGDALNQLSGEYALMRGSDALNVNASQFRLALEPLVPILRLFNGDIRNSREELERFDGALAEMVQRGEMDRAAEALAAAGISAEDAAAALPQYQAALQNVENEQSLAADSSERYARTMQEQAEKAEHLAGLQRDLASAVMESVRASLEAANSAIGYEAAIDKATASVEEHGATLDITTEAGRANKTALLDIAGAALRVAEDNLKAGQSTDDVAASMQTARQDFIDAAVQMGVSQTAAEAMATEFGLTKESVDNLSTSIEDVPASKKSEIQVEIDKALGAVGQIKVAIQGINGRTVDVNVRTVYSSIGAPGALSQSTRGGVTRASGGSVFGPGSETSDSIPALLSHNEHVLSAREVRGFGGHSNVERLRAMARAGSLPAFAGGGALGRPVFGGGYSPPASVGREVQVTIPVQTVQRADPVAIGAQVAWQVGGLP